MTKTRNAFFALGFALATLASVTTTTAPAEAADDALYVTTLNVSAGHTDCSKNNFGYKLDERAAVVRGRHHKIRIERHLVDVALQGATVSSCSGECKATITKQGNANGKGFVEIDLNVPTEAPVGNATLTLNYFGGGRGDYKLLIVKNSRVDRVERTTEGASTERYVLNGNNLDQLKNRFRASRSGASGFAMSRASEADASLVLDRSERNCVNGDFEVDLILESAAACRVNNVKIPATRDGVCGANGNPAPAPAPGPAPAPPSGGRARTPNLLPALVSAPSPLTRPLTGNVIATPNGGMVQVNSFFCAGLAANTPATVAVPKLTWGVVGADLDATPSAAFEVQLIDGATNAVIDRFTQNGLASTNPTAQRDNYAGRVTSIRVVSNPRFTVGSGVQTFPGCFTEPGSNQRLDSRSLIVRVDAGNAVNEGSRENDNDLAF